MRILKNLLEIISIKSIGIKVYKKYAYIEKPSQSHHC